jgi:arylsulfatase A-like enzyme/tetratricopeptide (TPR) repeat protein
MATIPKLLRRGLLASFGLLLAASPGALRASGPPPNVILITIDTLRADHLGCYGDAAIQTPNIDALARDGARFQHAFTPVPITLPSHTVMMTGTYPTASGMHDFSGNKLGASQATLAGVLHDAGYATGAVVASAVLDSRFGLNRGFDFYYDHFDFNRLLESNLDEMERPGNEVMDQALGWLDKSAGKRFFLWVHLYDPHYPYRPPAPYSEQYKTNPYDGEIAFADAQVGRLIAALKKKNLYGRTLIVLAGDHGEGLGEHGEKTHGFFIYDSTLHVPLIVKLPGAVAKPRVVNDEVSLADILPTVLGELAVKPPAGVQGRSLLPLVEGKPADGASTLYSETFLPRLHFDWSELRGLQTGGYHFIEAPQPELYDLSKDPHELHNLFGEKKAVGEEMRGKLGSTIARITPDKELAEKTSLDPALAERLKSLGYAGFSGGGSPTVASSKLPDPKDRITVYETVSEAIEASQHGRYEESVAKLRSTLATEKDSVPVHYLLGIDYQRLKDYPNAIAEFQRVLALSPDYSLATYYLGLAYANSGDFDQATATLKHALELDNTNFSAAFNLGAAYLRKQMAPEAEAAFRQSIQINADYAPGHRALGQMLVYRGEVEAGLAELRQAVQLAPEDPAGHAALAQALHTAGQDAEAQREMQRARELAKPQ